VATQSYGSKSYLTEDCQAAIINLCCSHGCNNFCF